MNRLLSIASSLLAISLGMSAAAQENHWVQWRGPNFNGSTAAKNLPEALDPAKPLWATAMPGHANGTPVIFGDHIFTTAAEDGSMKLLALCLSKKDGKILWQREIGDGFVQNSRNSFASPSPVTDGQKVIFLFGQGDIACFDMAGKQLWKRNLQADHGKWNVLWLYGSSPLLYKNKLYVPVLHRNIPAVGLKAAQSGDSLVDSYILALDPLTGKDLWKVVRPSDAVAESRESYATPIPWEKPARTEIVMPGGDCITGHDPDTGRELWRFGGWNPEKIAHWRLVPSAVTWDGLVYVCPPKGGMIRAIREGGSGDVTSSHLAWKATNLTSDVAVPLVYKDNLYILDGDRPKSLSCVRPKTGQIKWSGKLDSKKVLRGSPTGGDGKIYCTSEDGDVFVCSANEFKVLCKASLGSSKGPTRSSVAAVDGMIVIRTGDKLWAFGK